MSSIVPKHILHVDLTRAVCRQELLPSELLENRLGGRGLATSLISDYAGVDPLAADMPLIFSIGPLCGSGVPMSSRTVLTSRSPQTGTIFSSSSGGPFGLYLAAAELAVIRISGKSDRPLLLEIDQQGARLLPADKLWGKWCFDTLAELPGIAAVIGPTGEQVLPNATVETSQGESFGRGGLGSVMGSKGLKGILLRLSPARREIADPAAFDKAMEDLLRLFRASPFLLGPLGIHRHGTAALVDLLKSRGMLPGSSFQSFQGDETSFNAHACRTAYTTSPGGCHDCLVACKRVLPDGSWLPDYDQLAGFAGLGGVEELDKIVEFCLQCRNQGCDPISFAARLSVEQPQMVKGLELTPYDPRASTGLALSIATSTHAGSHLTAWPIASEILRKPLPTDRFSFDGKARVIAMFEDVAATVDSLALCRFASSAVELEELAALLAAVTGNGYTAADLAAIGRKTVLLERDFNHKSGFIDADDQLPELFFSQSANGLPPIDKVRFEQELAAYHSIRMQQCQ